MNWKLINQKWLEVTLGLSLLVGGVAQVSRADTVVRRVGDVIYYETPFNDMADPERRYVIKKSLELLIQGSKTLIQEQVQSQKVSHFALKNLDKAKPQVDELVDQALHQLSEENKLPGTWWDIGVPSAVMVSLGGDLSAGVVLRKGGAVCLGLVMIPLRVSTYNLRTGESRQYYSLDRAPIIIGTANVKFEAEVPKLKKGAATKAATVAKAGAKAAAKKAVDSSFYVGAGLIWGKLRRASDFKGVAVSAAGGVVLRKSKLEILNGGYMMKFGLLKSLSRKGLNPYGLVYKQIAGPAAGVMLHGNGHYVRPLGPFIRALFDDPETETPHTHSSDDSSEVLPPLILPIEGSAENTLPAQS